MKTNNTQTICCAVRRSQLRWLLSINRSQRPLVLSQLQRLIPRPPINYMDQHLVNKTIYSHRAYSTLSDQAQLLTSNPIRPERENFLDIQADLISIINKGSRTKDDLERIRSIMIIAATQDYHFFEQNKHKTLTLFLQYKKYQSFLEVYSRIRYANQEDEFLLIQYYLIKEDTTSIKEYIRRSNLQTLQDLLNFTFPFMTDLLKRPMKTYKLWIHLCLSYSGNLEDAFNENYLNLVSTLPSILKGLKSSEICYKYIDELVHDTKLRKAIILLTGRVFASNGDPVFLMKVWDLVPSFQKSSELLNELLIELLKQKYKYRALQLYKVGEKFSNHEVQHTIAPFLPHVSQKNIDNLVKLVERDEIEASKLYYQLNSLLNHHQFEKFDVLITALNKSPIKKTVDIINLQMRRSSESDVNDDVVQYLKEIYDLNEQPNSKTFEIIYTQFAKNGDIKAGLQLLDLLLQRSNILNIRHFILLITTCIRAQDAQYAPYILKVMKETNVKATPTFISSLMELHYTAGQFQRVESVFFEVSNVCEPSIPMFHILIKSYFARKRDSSAHAAFAAFKEQGFQRSPNYYLVLINYFAHQGLFVQALNALTDMKERQIKPKPIHYTTLMDSYNRTGEYENAIVVFNAANNEGDVFDRTMYRALLVSLVKLNVINFGNYHKPIELVDHLIKATHENSSPLKGLLPFSVIKPLVSSLIRFYRPDDAARIMNNYLTVTPQYNTDFRLSYMKQELKLLAANKKWDTYALIYDRFQERIKTLLNLDGIAPSKLKKVYNGILESLYNYNYSMKKQIEFAILFHDLLFLHGFTFSSHHINWVTYRLLRRKETFEYGMRIIEKRLIGGFIGQRLTNIERSNAKRLRIRIPRYHYDGNFIKPRLTLGRLTHEMLLKKVYDATRNDPEKLTDLKKRYPKTMKSVPSIQKRIRRRSVYYKKLEAQHLEQLEQLENLEHNYT